MFANAIMFNADPDRGVGESFAAIHQHKLEHKGAEGYEIDENSVVKDTRAMFAEVEKVVGDLRNAERASEATAMKVEAVSNPVEKSSQQPHESDSHRRVGSTKRRRDPIDEPDELAADEESTGHGSTVKRRRRG